jgi:hypothetical protein
VECRAVPLRWCLLVIVGVFGLLGVGWPALAVPGDRYPPMVGLDCDSNYVSCVAVDPGGRACYLAAGADIYKFSLSHCRMLPNWMTRQPWATVLPGRRGQTLVADVRNRAVICDGPYGSLSFLDPADGHVLSEIALPKPSPEAEHWGAEGMAVAAEGLAGEYAAGGALVVGGPWYDADNLYHAAVWVIDLATRTVGLTLDVDALDGPGRSIVNAYRVAADPASGSCFLTTGYGNVCKVDLRSGVSAEERLLWQSPPGLFCRGIVFDPTADRALVVQCGWSYADSKVLMLDAGTGAVLGSALVGGNAYELALHPAWRRVVLQRSKLMSVSPAKLLLLDADTLAIVDTWRVPGGNAVGLDTTTYRAVLGGWCPTMWNLRQPRPLGPVRFARKRLKVRGRRLSIQGVCYQPTPIGADPSDPSNPNNRDLFADAQVLRRDLPLLRALGANSVRPYAKCTTEGFLRKAKARGIMPVMAYYIEPWDVPDANASPRLALRWGNQLIGDFREYVRRYKGEAGVLMWQVGNEVAFLLNEVVHRPERSPFYFRLAEELAKAAHLEEGAYFHPVLCPEAETHYIGDLSSGSTDGQMLNLDAWGCNVFRGATLGSFWAEYAAKSRKPLVITEFGVDVWDSNSNQPDEATQAAWAESLWRDIAAHQDVCCGGYFFAYTDEWWKAGRPGRHDPGGFPRPSAPDGYASEEWYGLFSIQREPPRWDALTAREAYGRLAALYGGPAGETAEWPQVARWRPRGNDVPTDARVVVRFSKPMARQWAAVHLTREPNSRARSVPVTKSWSADGLALTLTPQTPLAPDTRYRIVAYAFASDPLGHPLGRHWRREFTTAPAASPALVTSLAAQQTAIGAEILFALNADADVSVTVLNIAGRPVRRVASRRSCEAGQNTLLWNGCADSGLRVPSGTYLIQITANGNDGSSSQALVPLRLTR